MRARPKRRISAIVGGVLLIIFYVIVCGIDSNTIPVGWGFSLAIVCELGAWFAFSKAGMIHID